ncbi:hypothetical protein PI125_g12362 [Phytophthora idaei]|nr:hypothetical protein PI125_g12362 [Phytophthora idaei]
MVQEVTRVAGKATALIRKKGGREAEQGKGGCRVSGGPKTKVLESILKKSCDDSAQVVASISYPKGEIDIGSSVFLGWEETEDLEEVIGSELENVELDALEACEPGQEATVLAGVEPAVEAQEYERG